MPVPPIPVLRAFEAVARLHSFLSAAEELNVTRSAVSHRIQMLENALGTAVFSRKQKSLQLTPSGSAYLVQVRKALVALDELASQNSESIRKRRLRLTTPPTYGRLCLIPRLARFLEADHGIEISVELSLSQIDMPVGEVDIDIRYGTGLDRGMEGRMLMGSELLLVTSPNYMRTIALDQPSDLARAQLLRSKLDPWKPWFTAAGLDWAEPVNGHRFEDLSLLYAAAVNGLGVALARTELISPLLDNDLLVDPFAIRATSPYSYYAVYRSNNPLRPEIECLLDHLTATPHIDRRTAAVNPSILSI